MNRPTARPCLALVLAGSICACSSQPPASEAVVGEVRHVPETWAVVRDVQGSYDQHPKLLEDLRAYLRRNDIAATAFVGIYPQDPDAVGMESVRWRIGALVDRRVEAAPPFSCERLSATTALIVESTVQDSAAVGLGAKLWITKNGYAHAGATRMRFPDAAAGRVTIVFPVKKRRTAPEPATVLVQRS